jgi:hypothetical protein
MIYKTNSILFSLIVVILSLSYIFIIWRQYQVSELLRLQIIISQNSDVYNKQSKLLNLEIQELKNKTSINDNHNISVVNSCIRNDKDAIISLRSHVSSKFQTLANDLININQNILLVREFLSQIWIENIGLENIEVGENVHNDDFKQYISICLENEHNLKLKGARGLDPSTPFGKTPSMFGGGEYYHAKSYRCDEKKYDIVVEYSMPNLINLKTSGLLTNDEVQYLVYVPSLPYDINIGRRERNIVPFTTFTYTHEPRRNSFLNRMEKNGIVVQNINNWEGSESIMHVYDSRGILLNMHQTDHHHTLEEFRVLPALTRGVIVISEDIPLRETVPYQKFIVWCKLEDFPETVKRVIDNYSGYFDSIFGPNSDIVDVLLSMKKKAKNDLRYRVDFLVNKMNLDNNKNKIQSEIIVNNAKYLYSKQGNEHILMDLLRDEKLAPLTKWTQMEIYKHQNPIDCSKSRFLVSEGFHSGFGSEMHVIGTHLAYAIQNNYVLLWGQNSCIRFLNVSGCTRGCACIYKEISKCSMEVKTNEWESINHGEFRHLIPDIFKDKMHYTIPSITDHELTYWWRAQSVGFLMRFNDDTISDLLDMRKQDNFHYMSAGKILPFPLPSGTINAHIRHGDKYKEMDLIPSEKYAETFESMVRSAPNSFSRIFFVSSDDESAIETCRLMTEKLKMDYIYTRILRMEGGHHAAEWDKMKFGSQRKLILSHLLQLLMALEADAYIGTRSSNWNRLIDELRCVWVDKCQNSYIELGVSSRDFFW